MKSTLFDAQLKAVGLPTPVKEHRFHPPRRWRFDYAWPEQMVALEIEGGTWVKGRHVRPSGYAKDCEKYSWAAIDGWRVIRATTEQVKSGEAIHWVECAINGVPDAP